jgi:3-oxoacyl-[acyl-carrier protein] reductase
MSPIDTVVITGASSGIGKSLYTYFKATGATTVGVGRKGPDREVDFVHTYDKISGKAATETAVLLRDYQPIDLFINNAGMFQLDELETPFSYISTIDVNLVTPYIFMMMMPALMSRGSCIINVGSVSGIRGEPDAPMYGATKAGIINLTKSFARILAPKGIRVNCISPGFFDTNLVGTQGEGLPGTLLDTIPIGREGNPDELINVVKFIWECDYMTGSNIVVDGGLLT